MARQVGKRDGRLIAKLVTENRAPCAFCRREVDDEVTYGNLYAIGDIQCHYFCALLSCCLVQKGPEEDGLFGFMYKDILSELERSKKHKCSFCGRGGANLGCSVGACRKQFHLPCGRERKAVSLYYGTYKSFCQLHAPKQKLPEHIMTKVKIRIKRRDDKKFNSSTKLTNKTESVDDITDPHEVCVICYEAVEAFPTVDTFWPPCCARDAWFHRSCLQRMALSAGMHYLKCPLCNDKQNFYEAVKSQGYYVPDRDAAWELEQNAFAEIYERPLSCSAETCLCPSGREHDADQGMWDIKLCLLCGSVGAHAHCMGASETTRYVCLTCTPAAPQNMDELADTIDKMIQQEQAAAASTVRLGPAMPSRMSLRRTKGRAAILDRPSCSGAGDIKTACEPAQSPNVQSSRDELNLKTPRRLDSSMPDPYNSPQRSYITGTPKKSVHSPYKIDKTVVIMKSSPKKSSIEGSSIKSFDTLPSPMKLLENRFREKVMCMGVKDAVLDEKVVADLKQRFSRPRPYSEKMKIINNVLDDILGNANNIFKKKEPLKAWRSPKKSYDVNEEAENITTGVNELKCKDNNETPIKSTKTTPNKVTSTPKSPKNIKELDFSPKNGVLNNKNELSNEVYRKANNDKDIKDDVKHAEAVDDSSNSTFQLPSEFIADNLSDDDDIFMGFPSPKRKTIDIKHDSSLEISEQDQTVNIDVIQNDPNINNDAFDKTNETEKDRPKCAFKFSPLDKNVQEKNKHTIDLENFKKKYLNEVDKVFKCNFNHKHDESRKVTNYLKPVIDFAKDAVKQKEMANSKKEMADRKKEITNSKKVTTDRKKEIIGEKRGTKRKTVLIYNDKNKLRKLSEGGSTSHSNGDLEAKTLNLPKNYKIEPNIISNDNEYKNEEIRKKQPKKKREEMLKSRKIKSKNKRLECKRELRTKIREQDGKPHDVIKVKENVEDSKETIKKEMHVEEIKSVKDTKNKTKTKETKRRYKKIKAKCEENHRKKFKRAKQKKQNIEVTFDSSTSKSKKKTKLSISNNRKNISVKIKWKKEQLRLKIESKNNKKKIAESPTSTKFKKFDPKSKQVDSKFKQYVLQYFSEVTSKEVLVRPEKEVSPLKRKYVKQEKNTDNLKQMSIQNFFKVKPPSE